MAEANELQPVEVEFDLEGTTGTNENGIPRQEIIRDCSERTRVFIWRDDVPGSRRIRVVVRWKYDDLSRAFGVVGEVPTDVTERYARHLDAGWSLALGVSKVVHHGSALGLRLRGQLHPPSGGEGTGFDL